MLWRCDAIPSAPPLPAPFGETGLPHVPHWSAPRSLLGQLRCMNAAVLQGQCALRCAAWAAAARHDGLAAPASAPLDCNSSCLPWPPCNALTATSLHRPPFLDQLLQPLTFWAGGTSRTGRAGGGDVRRAGRERDGAAGYRRRGPQRAPRAGGGAGGTSNVQCAWGRAKFWCHNGSKCWVAGNRRRQCSRSRVQCGW